MCEFCQIEITFSAYLYYYVLHICKIEDLTFPDPDANKNTFAHWSTLVRRSVTINELESGPCFCQVKSRIKLNPASLAQHFIRWLYMIWVQIQILDGLQQGFGSIPFWCGSGSLDPASTENNSLKTIFFQNEVYYGSLYNFWKNVIIYLLLGHKNIGKK